MGPQGWYRDPYGSHDDRWFSDGKPSSLVRDQGAESYDDPPHGRPSAYPRERPAGEQLPPVRAVRAGTHYPLWAAWLPGLLTIAVWGFFWRSPFFVDVLALVVALLAAAVGAPRWRPAITVTSWVAFVLLCVGIPLLLAYAIGQGLNSGG